MACLPFCMPFAAYITMAALLCITMAMCAVCVCGHMLCIALLKPAIFAPHVYACSVCLLLLALCVYYYTVPSLPPTMPALLLPQRMPAPSILYTALALPLPTYLSSPLYHTFICLPYAICPHLCLLQEGLVSTSLPSLPACLPHYLYLPTFLLFCLPAHTAFCSLLPLPLSLPLTSFPTYLPLCHHTMIPLAITTLPCFTTCHHYPTSTVFFAHLFLFLCNIKYIVLDVD